MCHALRATVFDRLRDALDGCTRLFISPDGGLTRLPFEVLPLPTEGRLMDRYDISYLSTGRDILRFEAQSSGHPTVPVVVADPDFDLTAESPLPDTVTPYPDAEQQRSSAARFVRDLGRERLEFGRLPWAHLEGERIAAQLNGELWCDDTALEARLKACQSPHILHLATHGYFLSDQDYIRDRSNIHQVQQNGIDISELYRFSKPELANPMLRSLLALAGANTWLKDKPLPPEAEDGLLTAADVSGLNLLSTELVVLSACQTALGDVRAGEGVFGLRRAFMLAGAKTLVMSLWDADDLATTVLMDRFYTNL